jgi:hypothetical protein
LMLVSSDYEQLCPLMNNHKNILFEIVIV